MDLTNNDSVLFTIPITVGMVRTAAKEKGMKDDDDSILPIIEDIRMEGEETCRTAIEGILEEFAEDYGETDDE
jgi:hypothetical protein